jgi:hypothetical protein
MCFTPFLTNAVHKLSGGVLFFFDVNIFSRLVMYAYVWDFQVHPDFVEKFEFSYGTHGEWIKLFKRHPAYVRTDLLKDQSDPYRFLTIDTWESLEQYHSFREEFRNEFDTLDKICEAYTRKESFLGGFDLLE